MLNVVSNLSFIVPDEDNDYVDTASTTTKIVDRNR